MTRTERFRNPAVSIDDRVADLLALMTTAEKIGQLNQGLLGWQVWQRRGDAVELTDLLDAELDRFGGIGAVYGLLRADAWSGRHWHNGADPQQSAEVTALVQERIVTGSRLGIPALFAEEAPHGHQALGGRLFPTNLGVAAGWRPELLEEAAAHIAAELRARGAHLALMSGLDLLRDPRWGRAEECFGEDPYLAAVFTRALVRGVQSVPGVGAVLKHFAGQGAGIGGRNGSGTPIGPRELAELHLPAARAGVDEGAVGLMAAYNDIDGVPCVANAELLTGTLRRDWGFTGLVMADMGAVDRLIDNAGGPVGAAATALRAGVDLSLNDRSFAELRAALDSGLIDAALLDRACARVLRVKISLGLLDPPQPAPTFPPPYAAADLVADSMVLIGNDGLLPLPADPGRVAVIGPTADDVDALLGDYVPPLPAGAGTTVLAGLRARLGADAVPAERGCELTVGIDGGLDRAATLAAAADLVVLALGSCGQRHYSDAFADNGAADLGAEPTTATTGEGFDLAEVELPAAQRTLVEAVTATGTPTVAVIVSGRPLGLDAVVQRCAAVLLAWYPGPDGGLAVTDLLFGDREPAGRLPVSLPRRSGTLPVAYNERSETARRYVDAPIGTDHPFGSGLGYTRWQLGRPRLTGTPTDRSPAGLALSAELANLGDRAGRQVVQLYGRSRVPGRAARRAVLLGHLPVQAEPGAQLPVTVAVHPDAVAGLGLPADRTECRDVALDLWLSVDGPGNISEAAVLVHANAWT